MSVSKLPPVAAVESKPLPKTSAKSKLPFPASATLPVLLNGSKFTATSLALGAPPRKPAKASVFKPKADAKSPLLKVLPEPPAAAWLPIPLANALSKLPSPDWAMLLVPPAKAVSNWPELALAKLPEPMAIAKSFVPD